MTGNDLEEINSEKTLATSLKHLSGAPLTDIEAQKATKLKLKCPNSPDEAMYMFQNIIASGACSLSRKLYSAPN
jgi:hypothetical protein